MRRETNVLLGTRCFARTKKSALRGGRNQGENGSAPALRRRRIDSAGQAAAFAAGLRLARFVLRARLAFAARGSAVPVFATVS